MTIPHRLRSQVVSACRYEWLRRLGTRAYLSIANRCATKLASLDGIRAVDLAGGVWSDCMPGASDLDFILLSDELAESSLTQVRVLGWRKTYHALKRRYFIPGELRVLSPSVDAIIRQIAPANLLWNKNRKRFHNDEWTTISTDPFDRISPGARFGIALHHYRRAHQQLACTLASPRDPYLRRSFSKEVNKALSYACHRGEPESSSPAKTMSLAFQALDALALTIKRAPISATRPLSLTPHLSSTCAAVLALGAHWRDEFRPLISARSSLVRSSVDWGLLCHADEGTIELEGLFFSYAAPKNINRFRPTLLSPAIEDLILMGWGWDPWPRQLAWITQEHLRDEEWRERFRRNASLALRDRAARCLSVAHGELISGATSRLAHTMQDLCISTLSLATGTLTCDLPHLARIGNRWPRLSGWLSDGYRTENELILRSLGALEESIAVLQNEGSAL